MKVKELRKLLKGRHANAEFIFSTECEMDPMNIVGHDTWKGENVSPKIKPSKDVLVIWLRHDRG